MNDETLNVPESDAASVESEDVLENEQAAAPEDAELEADESLEATETESDMRTKLRKLEEEIDTLKRDVQDNVEGWQRSRAEFANYKKRTGRELAESREKAALDTLTKVLPIIDDFERALDNIPEDLQEHPWISGTALILKKIDKLLESHEVEVIDPVGEPFNPVQHEAIGVDTESAYEPEYVTMTLQKGYISGERVLRPALVRVSG